MIFESRDPLLLLKSKYFKKHNFQDSIDPSGNFGLHIERTIHFFLHCSNDSNQRKALFYTTSNIKTFFTEPKWFNNSRNSLFWSKWSQCRRECIDNRISYRIYYNHIRLWINLSKFSPLLKFLIDSGSPYVILFSCLVVQMLYIYIYIYIYIYMQSWRQCAFPVITTMTLWTVHHVPKCISCYKAILVITWRAHCLSSKLRYMWFIFLNILDFFIVYIIYTLP